MQPISCESRTLKICKVSKKSLSPAFIFRKLLEGILYQNQTLNPGKIRQRGYEIRDPTQKTDEGDPNI